MLRVGILDGAPALSVWDISSAEEISSNRRDRVGGQEYRCRDHETLRPYKEWTGMNR
jgi:hypothetical protein